MAVKKNIKIFIKRAELDADYETKLPKKIIKKIKGFRTQKCKKKRHFRFAFLSLL